MAKKNEDPKIDQQDEPKKDDSTLQEKPDQQDEPKKRMVSKPVHFPNGCISHWVDVPEV